jgi:hypothetical protein
VSSSGAIGLMQVMPRDGIAATFFCGDQACFSKRPSSDELLDPDFNIAYGTRLLANLTARRVICARRYIATAHMISVIATPRQYFLFTKVINKASFTFVYVSVQGILPGFFYPLPYSNLKLSRHWSKQLTFSIAVYIMFVIRHFRSFL